MLRLERLQFVQEAIELSIRDLGLVVDVIQIFVAPDLGAERDRAGVTHVVRATGSDEMTPNAHCPQNSLALSQDSRRSS